MFSFEFYLKNFSQTLNFEFANFGNLFFVFQKKIFSLMKTEKTFLNFEKFKLLNFFPCFYQKSLLFFQICGSFFFQKKVDISKKIEQSFLRFFFSCLYLLRHKNFQKKSQTSSFLISEFVFKKMFSFSNFFSFGQFFSKEFVFQENLLIATFKKFPKKFVVGKFDNFFPFQNVLFQQTAKYSVFGILVHYFFFFQHFQLNTDFQRKRDKAKKKKFTFLLLKIQKTFLSLKKLCILQKIFFVQWFLTLGKNQFFLQKFFFKKNFDFKIQKKKISQKFFDFCFPAVWWKTKFFIFFSDFSNRDFFISKKLYNSEDLSFEKTESVNFSNFFKKLSFFSNSFDSFFSRFSENRKNVCTDLGKNLFLLPRHFSLLSYQTCFQSLFKFSSIFLFWNFIFFLWNLNSKHCLKFKKEELENSQQKKLNSFNYFSKKKFQKISRTYKKHCGLYFYGKFFLFSLSKNQNRHARFFFEKRQARHNLFCYLRDCKTLIQKAKGQSIFFLFEKLSKIFINFQTTNVSKNILIYLDQKIFQFLWKWAKQTHPKKSKNWIRKKYFLFLFKERKWVFGQKIGNTFYYLPQHTEKKIPTANLWFQFSFLTFQKNRVF